MGKALDKIEFLTFGTLTHPNVAVKVRIKLELMKEACRTIKNHVHVSTHCERSTI